MNPAAWSALVEREREREQIEAALTGAQRGQGRFVLVYGPSGAGRSSLLRASVVDARDEGLTVLEACGTELERSYGFGIVRQLLETWIVGLPSTARRGLLEELGGAGAAALGIGHPDPGQSGSAFDQIQSLHRLITRMAADTPVLVCVDDVQWCDRPSLDFLCFLGHRATRLPVMIIAAWRRGEPRVQAGRLQALAGKPDTLFLAPSSLSSDATRSLLRRELNSEPDDEAVALIQERTGGQPLLVSQLIEGLRRRRIPARRHCLRSIREVTPESVRRDIVARLGRHSETVQQLARGLAVMGDASLAQAAALIRIEEDRARTAASALTRAGILKDNPTVGYAQPLLRAAVYDTLSSLEAAQLHHDVAAVICDDEACAGPVDPRRVAAHLLRCEPSGDERFGRVLLEVARLTAEAGSDDEKRYLIRALGELDEPARGGVLVRLAERERRAGDLASAKIHAAEGLALARGSAEHLAAVLAAAQLSAASAGASAALIMLDAEARAAGGEDPEARAGMAAAAALMRVCLDLFPWPERERPAAEGPAAHAARAADASQMVTSGTGSAGQVRDLCAQALGGPGPRLGGGFSEIADYLASRSAILADATDLVAPRALDARDGEAAPGDLAIRAQLALSRGELSAAGSDARAALAATQDLAPSPLVLRVRTDVLAALVVIAIEGGRWVEASAALARLEACGEAAARLITPLRVALALTRPAPEEVAVALTRPSSEEVALALTSSAAEEAPAHTGEEPGWLLGPGISWPPLAALAHHASGHRRSALAVATAHLAQARDWGAASLLGRALIARARIDPGQERVQYAQEAVAILETTSANLELARARVELGAALRRARRRREARDQLTQGADLAHRCGAVALSERARSELIAAGARPRRAAFSGVGSLTLSELRVARLAASGLTNREVAQELVVSAKTISSQLTAIYRKLDVHDRAALTEAMCRGDNDPPDQVEPKLELAR